jgi:hypothetical protein
MATAYIESADAKAVVLRARFESDNGSVGDAHFEIRPGGTFEGYSFAELTALAASGGVVDVPKNGKR